MDDKNAVRTRMKALRRELGGRERAETARAAEKKLFSMPEFVKRRCFFTYLSYGTEVPTHALTEAAIAAGKTVAAPKVVGDGRLAFYPIASVASCAPGAFGILEPPDGRELIPEENGADEVFLLLPGLAFTKTGERLGYGGGFYDRYLAAHPGVFCAALAYPFSVLDGLPAQEHDMRADALILPEKIIYTNGGEKARKYLQA